MEVLSARQAAIILGVNERTVRRWIESGKIKATKLAANRYAIAMEDLPDEKLKGLLRRVEALEAEAAAKKEAQAQKLAIPPETPQDDRHVWDRLKEASSITYSPETPFLGHRSESFIPQPGAFPNRAALGRFFVRHGINRLTAKGWIDCPLDSERAALVWAVEHIRHAGYRAMGAQLKECRDNPACPCHDILV